MKMKAYMTVLCLLATALGAGAGELTPVACDADLALGLQPLFVDGAGFKPGQADCGLVSSQARVVVVSRPGLELQVAIDSSTAEAKAPDVIRFDFSGKGKFAGAASTALKPLTSPASAMYYHATFGPVEVKAAVKDKQVPMMVSGQYIKSEAYRQVQLTLGTALQGKCSFGDRDLAVRIIDGDGNFQLGNAWQRRAFGKNVAVVTGDTVAVDLGDGTFAKDVRKACYGSPVEVGGKWYEVAISQDGKQVTAKQVEIEAGKIHIDHPKWSCMLIGEKIVLPLEGGPEAIAVPAGAYVMRSYEEFSAPNDKGERARLAVGISPGAKSSEVTVEAGKTVELAIGSPLQATVKANKQAQQIILSLVLTDAGGRPITGLATCDGTRPPPPRIAIKDATGKQVYQNTLEYG
jgi:hypothetical protein